jgi:hypothetical protein
VLKSSWNVWLLTLGAVPSLLACGGPQRIGINTPGCVDATRSQDSIELIVGQKVSIPQPCPEANDGYLLTPIEMEASDEGLRIKFNVKVDTFEPGNYREEDNERDAVVVFPRGEGPGRPAIELHLEAAPEGYLAEDVIPWAGLGLTGPEGRFRLSMVVFNRQEGRTQTEVRIGMHVRVRGE